MSIPHVWAVFDREDELCSDALLDQQRACKLLPLIANAKPDTGPYYVVECQLHRCSDIQPDRHAHEFLPQLNSRESKAELIKRLIRESHGRKESVSIGSALEFRRQAYGLSIEDFSTILQIRRAHYMEIIEGKRDLTKNAIRRAYGIGVPAHVLLQSVNKGEDIGPHDLEV